MGMAASQVRLLQLTSRKNTIGRDLESLSLQKNSLSRDMRRVTKEYQEALNTKVLKWSNNSGVDYVDLSYKNLMTPSSANQNTPYLITDSSGKIVIDSKYKDYAQMITDNGGKYDDNVRAKILSGLISDVSESDITNANATSAAKTEAIEKYNDILEAEELDPTQKNVSAAKFANLIGTVTVGSDSSASSYDIGDLYTSGKITLGNSSTAVSALENLCNDIASSMDRYLGTDDAEAWKKACKRYYDTQETLLSGSSDDSLKEGDGINGLTKSGDNYVIKVGDMIDTILENYKDCNGTYIQDSSSSDSNGIAYTIHDEESTEWQEWKTDHDAWEAELAAAYEEVQNATDTDNQSLTSEQEQKIAFYDQLFTAIADNGWTSDAQVSDNDYLNQMMQNGLYYITTMSQEETEDSDGTITEYYEYSSTPAANFDMVFSVNDSDAQEEALVNYEYEKSIISEKETRLDTRMQDLETEQSAINEMIKGIETVRNDNEERTFSIFS